MVEFAGDSGDVLEIGDERPATCVRSDHDDTRDRRTPVANYVVIYDALDYRLMATFPASDAVAQY